MSKKDLIQRTPKDAIDQDLLTLCLSVKAKRARTVIDHILTHGIITSEDLRDEYGYDHPPRAIRDVRDNGIPIQTHNVKSPKTGRRIGAYTFGDPRKIKAGRIGGRKAFSKAFKQELIHMYGSRDAITGARLDERYLQIDHRVPYEVAGEASGPLAAEDFMLLDGSSNRAKSWSCEHCQNFIVKQQVSICKTCFWASPENYQHIAEKPVRRLDIVWQDGEVADFEQIKAKADSKGISVADFVKSALRKQ